MEMPKGFEKVISCPYNMSHQILPHRMQTHLTKCAKQHPHIKLEICPFNVTHRMKYVEMQEHKLRCPDRISFDEYLLEIGPKKESPDVTIVHPSKQMLMNPFVTPDESWDDLRRPTYDFKTVAESKNVLRHNTGMTKFERQVFRQQEFHRLKEIQKNLDRN